MSSMAARHAAHNLFYALATLWSDESTAHSARTTVVLRCVSLQWLHTICLVVAGSAIHTMTCMPLVAAKVAGCHNAVHLNQRERERGTC